VLRRVCGSKVEGITGDWTKQLNVLCNLNSLSKTVNDDLSRRLGW
jgi:hypothetical protein